jgi:nucleoside-diphosphate-sugar epimerase
VKRVAITGAGGFVGRALCHSLSTEGMEITAVIRSGDIPQGASETHRIGDITDRTGLRAAFEGVDAVVHLAGRAHVMQDDTADPLAEYRRINVEGTKAVADCAADAGAGRVVFVSSIMVNGERTDNEAFSETDAPAPEDPYGVTKREAEEALFEIARARGIEAICLRPPLVYGPGVRANFAALMKLCDSSFPLPFGGITHNRRSLIFVGNLTSAIKAALSHENAAGRVFLVRDGEDLSTAGLIRVLRQALGRSPRLVPVPASWLNAMLCLIGRRAMAERLLGSLTIDDSAFRTTLGWTPPLAIADAMEVTARAFRNAGKSGS